MTHSPIALPSGPLWDPRSDRLAAAARVCSRAGAPDPINWAAARDGAHPEETLFTAVQSLESQIGWHFSSPGWDPLLARLFFDADAALAASGAPLAAWEWSDVKSKFGALRAYGRPASLAKSALERCLFGLSASGGRPDPSETLSGAALRTLEERMLRLGVGAIPRSQEGSWTRRMGVSPADEELHEEHLNAFHPAAADCSLLADAAENILSTMICEMCGGPARIPLRHGGGSSGCDGCNPADAPSNPALSSREPRPPLVAMPKTALALTTLAMVSLEAAAEHRRKTTPRASWPLATDEAAYASFERARDLSPIAELALASADVNADLGRGLRLAHFHWPLEALFWLDHAGCDWSAPNPQGQSAADALRSERPEAWALIERRALGSSLPAPASAPPRKETL